MICTLSRWACNSAGFVVKTSLPGVVAAFNDDGTSGDAAHHLWKRIIIGEEGAQCFWEVATSFSNFLPWSVLPAPFFVLFLHCCCVVGVPGLVTVSRKRMALSLKEKVEILREFEKYPKKCVDHPCELGWPVSTLNAIVSKGKFEISCKFSAPVWNKHEVWSMSKWKTSCLHVSRTLEWQEGMPTGQSCAK